MNYLLSSLDSLPYFTIQAVKQLFGEDPVADGTIRTAVYRWMKSGQIIQLKKGTYMTRRFYEAHHADIDFTSMVSTILIPQSYLSLEYVLQRNAILTEVTYPVTAVTVKQTRVFENTMGTFSYRNIKPDLYGGFSIGSYLDVPIPMAYVSKALFDFFYFRPWRSIGPLAQVSLTEELRLNLDDFSTSDQYEYASFVELSKSNKMEWILNYLRRTIWHP
jgi:predicted transcriptional regulator of viral defense system